MMVDSKLELHQIAQMIDLSAVQAENDAHYIEKLIATAKNINCIALFTLPSWIPFAKEMLGENSAIILGGPVGFPSGGNTTAIKVAETTELIEMGCGEIDVVINIGKLLSGRYQDAYDDIRAVVEAAGSVPVKVILECHYLSDKDILEGCDIVTKAGAAWVKTGSGWPASGATAQNIKLIRDHVGDQVKIKAAGGIRDLTTLLQLYDLGARRFGIGLNSALDIIEQLKKRDESLHTGLVMEQY
jgi:deoxyribose-phosphate aldolase